MVYDLEFRSDVSTYVLNITVHEIYEFSVNFFQVRLHYAVVTCNTGENVATFEFLSWGKEHKSHLHFILILVVPEVAISAQTCHFHPLDALERLDENLILLLSILKTILLSDHCRVIFFIGATLFVAVYFSNKRAENSQIYLLDAIKNLIANLNEIF